MELKLISKKQETSDVKTFVFEFPEDVSWKAGQYMRYRIPNEKADEKGIMRYFTNAAAPFEGHSQITTRYGDPLSTFKQDLDLISIGGEITANGPFGDFTVEDTSTEMVFVAGGIGITPFRSILMQLDHDKRPFKITLLYGNRSEDVAFKTELEELKQRYPENFKIFYAIGNQYIDAPFITSAVPEFLSKKYYLSGPEPMVKGIEATLAQMGVKEDQIKKDYFPGYDGI